jgi:hypothetical protein
MKVKLEKNGKLVTLTVESEDHMSIRCIPAKEDTPENRAKGLHVGWISDGRIAVRLDRVDQIKWGSYPKSEPHRYKDAVRFSVTGEIPEDSLIRADGSKIFETNDLVDVERTALVYQKHDVNIRLCIKKEDGKALGIKGVQEKYDPLLLMGEVLKQERDANYDPVYVYDDVEDGPIAVVMPVTIYDDCTAYLAKTARDILAVIA